MAHTAGKGPDDFVFPYDFALPDGKKHAMKTGRLYKVWKKACSDAGVKHVSLQQPSRHSFATEIKNKHDKAEAAEDYGPAGALKYHYRQNLYGRSSRVKLI